MATWTLAALRGKRDEILAIAASYGAHNLRVFGSVARGDARPDSDVDIVVEFEPGRSLLDQGGLIMDLQDALGCKVDVLSARGMRARLRARVEAEAVAI
jgi:predicted nucleotidyltransferase